MNIPSNRPVSNCVVAGVLAFASATLQAQTVTVSGIADAAARYVDNSGGKSVKSLVSGSNSTSRIIIRGVEDLGDGLTAGFHLEHGILLDAGAAASATQFWDRRSTVSVTSPVWGELRLGRDFVPSYVSWTRYDPFSYVGVAGSNNLVSATPNGPIRSAFSTSPNTTVRSSNAIQWFTPTGWPGFEGALMVAAGEGGTAANGQHKVIGARVGWVDKRFAVSAATTRSENNLTVGDKFKDHAIGGQVDLGIVRLSAAYRRFDLAAADQTNTMLGATVPVGQGEVKVSWVRADLDGRVGATPIGANDAQQWGLGYVYWFSKRSNLYATASRIDNKGTATFVVPGGAPITAGGKSTGAEFGMRHSF
jgi:predicted porin